MPCYHPLQAKNVFSPSGEKSIVFLSRDLSTLSTKLFSEDYFFVPCGQCVGCRIERSRQWAIRCMHEASLYDNNCFITLTYNNDNLPFHGSLNKRDFQLFFKRLRKRFGVGIRYYMCGEYGEQFSRPHYHACIFNHDFADKELFKIVNKERLYRSESLEQLWPYGYSLIGSVTFKSAAYVARYILKKATGKRAIDHYKAVDFETGELYDHVVEYTDMSRRGGIGKGWYDKYKSDVYPDDFVVVNGQRVKPPKYYDKLFDIDYPDDFAIIKQSRVETAKKFSQDTTPERLAVKEKSKLLQLKKLVRTL